MKNKIFGVLLSLCISISILFSAMLPIVSYADNSIIYIDTADEFIEFSKNCSFDAWSKDKNFVLTADISLEGEVFAPIPSFSGTFDGNGHTISGINIYGAYSPAGLFAVLLEGGIVRNLKVKATISPEGNGDYVGGIVGDNSGTVDTCIFTGTVIGTHDVGGIVGINRICGTVNNCSAFGEIIGENRTGGIAGSNEGFISSSFNDAKVNTISVTPELTLDELNVSLTLDITKLPSLNNGTTNDTGGIAGYSTGIIMSCENSGEIGYKHIGYNVGGIAGRNAGHLASNKNTGNVYGRKDVGGIVGQMEPYISYNLSEDLLALLKTELDSMHQLIGDAANAADKELPAVSQRIDNIIGLLGDASDSLDEMTQYIMRFGESMIVEVNRTGNILANVISQLTYVTAPLPEISASISSCLESLEDAVDSLNDVSTFSKATLANMQLAVDEAALAAGCITNGVQNISNGISTLFDAVIANDEAAIIAALDDLLLGLTELSGAIRDFSSSLSNISEALETNSFSELSSDISGLANAMLDMSGGIYKIASGVAGLISNLSLDFSKASDGLSLIVDGLAETVDSTAHLESALIYLSDTIDDLEGLSDALDVTLGYSKTAISHLTDATKNMTDMLTAVDNLVGYLDGVNPIQIPMPSPGIKTQANKLFSSLSALETELANLNADLTVIGGELTDMVTKMNDSFSNIYNNIVNMIYGLNEGISVDNDISEEEIDNITNGKVFDSHNSGSVYGDINVGGISGAIGIEYTLDPEDDMSAEISVTQKKQYQLKAVIHACVNSGDVTAKRDSVGGVVGKMDFGTIYACESYADLSSESGNYIGGIAGISAGRISECFAKGSLSGGKYIGGIIGSGVTEDLSGDSSLVKDCYSMVEIIAFKQYAGGIAGILAGEFSGNYFVSNTLAGIDRISYQGKAEPLSYADLIKRRSIPNEFCSFTLDFIASGEVIKSVSFNYGYSFDSAVFPEIPKKEGHYGYWDTETLENLIFDTEVNVIYTPYITTIGSDNDRDGKRVFLVEGDFTESDKLLVNINDSAYSQSIDKNLFFDYKIVECWKITIPDDNNESHDIHFLPDSKNAKIYLMQNGERVEVEITQLGSYLTFEASGNDVEIAVVVASIRVIPAVLLLIGVLGTIALLILLAIMLKKKKTPNDKSAEKQKAQKENTPKKQKKRK